MKQRCKWCEVNDLMIKYHDNEWGDPLHDDEKLFEFIVLDTFQAGLSWKTILTKRENFRKAFDNFDVKKIACYNQRKIEKLLADVGIIRNKLKVTATVANAKSFLKTQKEFGSFAQYIWQFVNNKTKVNNWKHLGEIPVRTKESDTMSKDLRKRGFKFVGSTICYAFMQAVGLVNDHLVDCFRYEKVNTLNTKTR